MKNNKKKILIYSMLGIITVLIVTLTITYAYWILTRQQTGENVVNTACLNISFLGENDITLDKAYPMNPEQLENFLSTETPYHFTIHNECSELASATINLESLNAEAEKQLQDEYINAILYEDDYHANLNSVKQLGESIYNDENKVIEDSLHAYKLHSFTLKGGDTKEFNLLLYMDPETPMEEDNMNASWKGKITLSSEYTDDKFINAGTLREVSSSDEQGMWEYKNKLIKIEIQDEIKSINEGELIYGPFDESEKQDNSIKSYVVCKEDDANCIGYLQGDGGVKLNTNSSNLFSGFSNVINITGLENLDTSEVTNMSGMFNSCSSLTSLDLSSFDTNNVANINSIFKNDTSLTIINLSNWIFNDSILRSFASSSSLNTCSSIENLILDEVDTSNVTNLSFMFAGLTPPKLTTLDLSDFDTSHVTAISGIFSGAAGLTNLNISNWDLSGLTSNPNMFGGNALLKTINATNVVFPINSTSFFSAGLTGLNNIILDGSDTSHVTNMSGMFSGCSGLTELDLSSFDTSNITSLNNMFYEMSNLQELNLSNWKYNDSIANDFNKQSGLNTCSTLENLILENVDTSEVTNMSNMFASSQTIKELDLSSFDTSHVTTISSIFGGTVGLTKINISNWNLSSLIDKPSMFGGNNILETINATNVVFPKNSSGFFSTLLGLKNITLKNINTSSVTDMSEMFSICTNLHELDLSEFDTRNVTNFNNMFALNSNLQSITFGSKFVHKPEATIVGMFGSCLSQDRPTDNSWSGVSFD